jgi:cytidylate kinase
MIIAIDGPAAAGKGTLARKIADHFGFAYLDTGSLYRATALTLIRNGNDNPSSENAVEAAKNLDPSLFSDADLRSEETGRMASHVAKMEPVRAALKTYQRAFAATPPDGAKGAVLDGRDIGTVICPDAPLKLFVTASSEVRAKRRWLEEKEKSPNVLFEDVLAQVVARDEQDQNRPVAPLKPADDAHILNTSEMDIDTVFKKALELF